MNHDSHPSLTDSFQKSLLGFVETEINTSFTFASLALDSLSDPEKQSRNLRNARKGYESALHFLKIAENRCPDESTAQLANRLKQLKQALVKLGEVLD